MNEIIKSFKAYTSKELVRAIQEQPESRREWLLNKFRYAAGRTKRGAQYKLWKDGFHPVLLDTPYKIEQRVNYTHNNPLELQLVKHPRDWINSSYRKYED